MGVRPCFLLLFVQLKFLEQIGEVLTRILLLPCLKLFMAFTNQRLEDSRSDSILIELVFLLFCCGLLLLASKVDLLSELLLRVLPRLQTDDKF